MQAGKQSAFAPFTCMMGLSVWPGSIFCMPLEILKNMFLYASIPDIPANLYDNEFFPWFLKNPQKNMIWYLAYLKENEILNEKDGLSKNQVNFWFYILLITQVFLASFVLYIFGAFLRNDRV